MRVISTNSQPLSTIFRKIKKKQIVLPIWQRKDVWSKEQIDEWIKTIQLAYQSGSNISGMITTFRYESDEKDCTIPEMLNDGAQRIFYNLPKVVNALNKDGVDKADDILDNVQIAVQYVIYDDIVEATREFYRINALGTGATPYELAQSIFAEKLSAYGDVWKEQLDRVISIVNNALTMLGSRLPKETGKIHARNRDSLALFRRYAVKDKARTDIQVANKHLIPSNFKEGVELEEKLGEFMKKEGSAAIDEHILNFEKYIKEMASYVDQLFKEEISKTQAPIETLARWYFCFLLYCKNNEITYASYDIFIRKMLRHAKNMSRVIYEDNGNNRILVLSTQKLSILGRLQQLFGHLEGKPKRDNPECNPKDGYVKSHINAISATGCTEVVPENALTNRFRGNRDMTEDDKTKLLELAKPLK